MATEHKHRHHHHDAWTCTVCGEAYAVPSLARACEQAHEKESDE